MHSRNESRNEHKVIKPGISFLFYDEHSLV